MDEGENGLIRSLFRELSVMNVSMNVESLDLVWNYVQVNMYDGMKSFMVQKKVWRCNYVWWKKNVAFV